MAVRSDEDGSATALPPWPTPSWMVVDDDDALAAEIARIREAGDPAIGLHVFASGTGETRWLEHDHRLGQASLVALARDPARCHGHPCVVLLDPATVGDLQPLLSWLSNDEAPYVVMHDAQAILYRLASFCAPDPEAPWSPVRLGSTQAAAILLAEGSSPHRDPPSLETCVARVLAHRIESPPLTGSSPDDPQRRTLTVLEASALLPLMQALTPMLRRRELTRVYGLECRLLPAVVAMERAGMGVDAAAFVRVADAWADERRTATAPDRIARLDKLLSTYAHWPREFIRADRIHPLLHPLAADSGRFSCTNPNLQQVPSEHTAPGLRACFRPPPGRALVVADYAQIELRVAAHLAPCEALRRVFLDGRDPHRATAATITGRPEHEITDRQRKLAKAVNFGFLFGMGARRFRSYARQGYGVELDEAQAQQAREAFLATFPGIAAWHQRVGRLGRRDRSVTVRTAMGRRKRFAAERFSFNAALNIPVQGTAAEGFKLALIELHERLPALGARGVMCVHDEYIAEVPVERADEACTLVVRTMREAMASIVTSVPIEVDARVADRWS